MNHAAQKAQMILTGLKIDTPSLLIYLNEICMARKVYVREGELDGAEARLTIAPKGGFLRAVILVKPAAGYQGRTRFSIAHELGHFEIHQSIPSFMTCHPEELTEGESKSQYQRREKEANEFASELLMPTQFIGPEIERSETPSFGFIERLAKKYHTSLFATARRFIDLTKATCAFVYFDRNQVLFHLGSKSFKDRKYRIEPGPIPKSSFAFEVASGKRVRKEMSKLDAFHWIKDSELNTIQEESRFFSKLGKGLSLLWI